MTNYSRAQESLKEKGECYCTQCVIMFLSRLEKNMNKEQKFWQQMKKSFGLDLMKRVENSIEPGFPDVHFLHNGTAGWIELKAQAKFPSSIDFEPAQPLWLTKYWDAGGECFVFLKVIEEKKVYVWNGGSAMKLDEKGGTKEVPPIFVFDMSEEGWAEIYELFSSVRE